MDANRLESASRIALRFSLALLATSASFFVFRPFVFANVPNPPQPGALLKAKDLEVNFAYLEAAAGYGDCPVGYARDASVIGHVVCKSGADEMVKVGTGASAFWIDRYEASVWASPDAMGMQYGMSAADYPAFFPKNGQRVAGYQPLYAVSKAGILPSAFLTWFQAQQACRANGKALPDGEEWLAAASGTADGLGCNTASSGPWKTGLGSACVSAWGAEDMIGNLHEWTAEWYTGLGDGNGGIAARQTWPGEDYNGDHTWNIGSAAKYDTSNFSTQVGLPAGALHGGSYDDGITAGVFAMNLELAPLWRYANIGFRCIIRR